MNYTRLTEIDKELEDLRETVGEMEKFLNATVEIKFEADVPFNWIFGAYEKEASVKVMCGLVVDKLNEKIKALEEEKELLLEGVWKFPCMCCE